MSLSNSISLDTAVQARPNLVKVSCSQRNWASRLFKSSPSVDSVELSSENELLNEKSVSKADESGFNFKGAGGDRTEKFS